MRRNWSVALWIGVGMTVAVFWLLAAGVLQIGDRQLDATIADPAGDGRPSPSAATTGPLGAVASQQGAGGKTPSSVQSVTSQGGSATGAATTSSRPNNTPPLLILSPAAVVPENVVSISGQGFTPGEQLSVRLESAGAKQDSLRSAAMVDKDGNFYGVAITVTTDIPAGSYPIVASSRSRKAEAILTVVGGTPYATPSTYSGKGGTAVGFVGGGFNPNEIVSLHFDSLAVDPLLQVVASYEGAVAITGTTPLADPGEHAFFLIGAQSNVPLRIPFSMVAFNPWFSPDNYSPTPEQSVGFTGHDFAPDEDVRIFRSRIGPSPVATARADKNGEFAVSEAYQLPSDALGNDLFVAVGTHSRTVVSTTLEVLPFNPILELGVYAGRPGTVVTFKGTGYGQGEMITAYLGSENGGREVTKFQAGQDGTFEGAGGFHIPAQAKEGELTITAVGERSRTPRELTFAVLSLSPWAGLTAYAGPPGTSVSFEGHDFLPGENVTIHLGDGHSPVLGTVQADESGGFRGGGRYTVPEGTDGKVSFTVVGETSQGVATATFTVTQGDPSAVESDTKSGETDTGRP